MRFIDRSFGEITIRAETDKEMNEFNDRFGLYFLFEDEARHSDYYAIGGLLVIVQHPLKVIKERVESHLVGDRYVKKTVCSEE